MIGLKEFRCFYSLISKRGINKDHFRKKNGKEQWRTSKKIEDMATIQLLQVSPEELTQLIKEGLKPEIESLFKEHLTSSHQHKEFLTRKETAKFFDVSLVCIHDWCNKNILIPYKVGNRTYFKYSDLLESLLSSNKRA